MSLTCHLSFLSVAPTWALCEGSHASFQSELGVFTDMNLMKTLSAGAAALALSTAFATVAVTPVMAQQTTSEIRGVVTDAGGQPLSGASVTVLDTRTGATRRVSTDADGGFSARGLTVGGPYTVTVSASGFGGERITDVSAGLGAATSLNFALNAAAASSDEIVVVSTRSNTAELAVGPSSSFNLEQIQSFPSISRDIRDIIRIDPRVSIDPGNEDAISCIGGNNRFNSFTIDGVRNADSFGLNASGFPTRELFAIPFDAVRETSVEFAPFDVEYGQFTGCNINIVTKSGTNEFHGAAFAVFSSDGLTGSTLEGDTVISEDFRDYNWGASVGGPIIKDKLFFYVAYEETDDGSVQNSGPAGGGFANEQDITLAQAQQVQSILENLYGLPAGGVVSNLPEESRRILTRWDWLINDDHRLEFTYARTRESITEPDALFGDRVALASTFRESGARVDSYSARLFSQWTDNFSTEIRASRLDNEDLQNPLNGGELQDSFSFPQFLVATTPDGCNFGSGFQFFGAGDCIVAGPGQARSANQLNTQVDQIKVKGNYVAGAHNFTFGYELDQLDVFNLFIFNANGTVVFDSIADLEAGVADSILVNSPVVIGDAFSAAADFSRSIHSIYAQDEWSVTDDFTFIAGLRYDFYVSDDQPTLNPNFVERYGFSNTQAFDGLDVFQPRIGFTWDAPFDFGGATQFRGGAGIFAGGDPTVWFANSFQNFGGAIGETEIIPAFGSFDGDCALADLNLPQPLPASGVPSCLRIEGSNIASANLGEVQSTDPDFELPSLWRFNLGFTHNTESANELLDNWTINVDFLHTRVRNAQLFQDISIQQVGTAPDGRPIFNNLDPQAPGCNAEFINGFEGFSNVTDECFATGRDDEIFLTNTDRGSSTTVSASFAKTFEAYWLGDRRSALDFQLGYAWTDVNEVHPGTSSTATSNFGNVATSNFNNLPVATGNNEIRHNITAALRFSQEFVKDYETSLNFFFQARTGRPFSYAFNTGGFAFGDPDGGEPRSLFYVPEINDPLVTFANGEINGNPATAAQIESALNAFIDQDDCLSEARGAIISRNSCRSDWFVDLDLRFQQELPGVRTQDRSFFFVDIENVLNLISDEANILREVPFGTAGYTAPIVDTEIDAATNTFVYNSFFSDASEQDRIVDASVWQVQIGFRYEF